MTSTLSPAILAVVADLMFGSKIRGAADAAGMKTIFARNEDALKSNALQADLILIDLGTGWLDAPRVIAELKQSAKAPVIAFASHVDTDAIKAAQAAGADRVLARSAFVTVLPGLLLALRNE